MLRLVTKHQLEHQQGPGAAVLARLVSAASARPAAGSSARSSERSSTPASRHRSSVTPIGPYTVDFYWPSHRLVVETDGAALHDHAIAQRRDTSATPSSSCLGYTILRIPEDELPDAPATVARLLSRRASRRAS